MILDPFILEYLKIVDLGNCYLAFLCWREFHQIKGDRIFMGLQYIYWCIGKLFQNKALFVIEAFHNARLYGCKTHWWCFYLAKIVPLPKKAKLNGHQINISLVFTFSASIKTSMKLALGFWDRFSRQKQKIA